MVLAWGEQALEALTKFDDKHNGKMFIRTFQPLQGLLDWRRMDHVIQYLGTSRASPRGLASLTKKLAREDWYRWHLMHTELGDRIHQGRSMSHDCICVPHAVR